MKKSTKSSQTNQFMEARCNKADYDVVTIVFSFMQLTALTAVIFAWAGLEFDSRAAGPVPRGSQGVLAPPIDMLGPPINKLTFLKREAVVLNFKLWLPLINAWPP